MGATPKSWACDRPVRRERDGTARSHAVPEHPAPGHYHSDGGKEKSGQGAGNAGLIFCNKMPEGRLQNCSATSGDIKKWFSKSSLNGVIKGCLLQGEPRTNLSTQSLLTDVPICEAQFPTGHPSPNQQKTIHLQTNRTTAEQNRGKPERPGRALPVDGGWLCRQAPRSSPRLLGG